VLGTPLGAKVERSAETVNDNSSTRAKDETRDETKDESQGREPGTRGGRPFRQRAKAEGKG
jgi:hypothetical protein